MTIGIVVVLSVVWKYTRIAKIQVGNIVSVCVTDVFGSLPNELGHPCLLCARRVILRNDHLRNMFDHPIMFRAGKIVACMDL